MVRKKGGSLERFAPIKVRLGLENAFRKRKLSTEDFEDLIMGIDIDVSSRTSTEIESKQIGLLILEKLQKLDMVAYVRFASVYCEVNTLEEFVALLPSVSLDAKQGG
jgi:transcriptional repressor NrdR